MASSGNDFAQQREQLRASYDSHLQRLLNQQATYSQCVFAVNDWPPSMCFLPHSILMTILLSILLLSSAFLFQSLSEDEFGMHSVDEYWIDDDFRRALIFEDDESDNDLSCDQQEAEAFHRAQDIWRNIDLRYVCLALPGKRRKRRHLQDQCRWTPMRCVTG